MMKQFNEHLRVLFGAYKYSSFPYIRGQLKPPGPILLDTPILTPHSKVHYLEELVLYRSKGANQVSDVIGYDDHLPALRALRSEHGHLPGQHANLKTD